MARICKPIKLVLLGYFHGYGGAEKSIIMLANAMADRGHKVTMIALVAEKVAYPISDSVEVVELKSTHGTNRFFAALERYRGLKRALFTIEADIVVSFWIQPVYFCALMRKKNWSRLIYSERGDPSDSEYRGILGILRTLSLPKVDGFVFQSEASKKYFDSRVQKKGVVIQNPLLIPEISIVPPEARKSVIVSVGRLHPQKNHLLLIKAFSGFVRKHPEYLLEIYGEGELHNDLQQEIDQLDLTNRVILKGAVPDLHSRIANSSMFVLSSDYEGFPNTLIEALALGIPCITTDWKPGAAKEVFSGGIKGVIVRTSHVQSLQVEMCKMAENPMSYSSCIKNASLIRSRLNPENIYGQWEDFLYASTLS